VVNDSRDNGSLGTSKPDAANLGLVRPPVVYLSAIALGLVLHFLWPARLLPPSFTAPLGTTATLLAVVLFVAAVRTLRAAGTPVPGNRPTTAIVRSGPYRFSRNPSISRSRSFSSGSPFGSTVWHCWLRSFQPLRSWGSWLSRGKSATSKHGFPRSICSTSLPSVGGYSRADLQSADELLKLAFDA
jgi:protein-S-isoprenylcysteine O-methyltransferase Ste14